MLKVGDEVIFDTPIGLRLGKVVDISLGCAILEDMFIILCKEEWTHYRYKPEVRLCTELDKLLYF